MIYLYSGTPGSGKSLHTACVIYWTLRRKLPVIANFPIALNHISKKHPEKLLFEYWDNMELTPSRLVEYARDYWSKKKRPVKEGELLCIIDESQILFNARDWKQQGRSDWLKFFTQHRKFGYDIILVAQFDEMLDKQLRALIEYQVIHRKVSNFGIAGKILSAAFLGKLFVAVRVWYPMGERVGSEMFTAKKKYYSLYDTYADFGQL